MPRKTRGRAGGPRVEEPASMRPRPDAAENLRCHAPTKNAKRMCFNEAAARCRGKRARSQVDILRFYELQ